MPTMMKRDPQLERELVAIAAASEGLASWNGGELRVDPIVERLNAVADERAWPGGVEVEARPVPLIEEAKEEIADLRSYLVWKAQSLREQVGTGDSEACDEYARVMRALAATVAAWAALAGH
jgi:hypothetical protein